MISTITIVWGKGRQTRNLKLLDMLKTHYLKWLMSRKVKTKSSYDKAWDIWSYLCRKHQGLWITKGANVTTAACRQGEGILLLSTRLGQGQSHIRCFQQCRFLDPTLDRLKQNHKGEAWTSCLNISMGGHDELPELQITKVGK